LHRWFMRGLLAAALAGVAFVVVRILPTPVVTAPSGVALGRLPSGVAAGDLSLLLVTLDTTRADRIGSYGFADIETPHLDRLAREGVVFEQAESVAPLTLPAHSSMFTGEFPLAHGVRDNGGFYLDEEHVVLAELLRDAGLRTGGFVGAFVLDAKWGIAQGFDTYFDDFDLRGTASLSLGEIERPASEVADAALAWLDEAPEARFFSWVHFYDPHSPYDPPEPHATRYRDRPYVGEIAYVDSQIGRLLEWLDRNDRTRDTVVMAIGDHGESLGEHGESGHGFFVYGGAIRVPFIVRAPYDSMEGRRVNALVRAVDVLPTALDLLGVDYNDETAGVTLASLLTGAERSLRLTAYSEAVYPRYHFGWSDLRALRAGDLKYIAAPRPELYDLSTDPNEEKNLYSERSAQADRMHAQLTALESEWQEVTPAPRVDEVDPDTRARLAALGYVGSFVSADPEPSERSSLADPKDKIHLYNLMRRAREASLGEGGAPAAIDALRQVLDEDPEVIDAWVRLGNEHLKERQLPAAIESYRKALELKPDYDLAVINLANAYRSAGKPDDAMLGYRQFLRLDPRNAQVRYQLAQMLLERNELEEAEEHLREAVQFAPKMAAAQNARGVIALKRSDPETAVRLINEALAMKPDVRLAHFNLALVAEARGDAQEAARLYREELELYPESYKVEFNLGLVLGAMGDRKGEAAALRRAIEINPDFVEGHFFLAKTLLDAGERLDEAIELAQRGLELGPSPAIAPMGHYLLADIFTRLGRTQEAERELASARALERES
jgi:arylsulfatase A-like enzyme/Tfp pilus assembly protein PilF